MTEPFEVEIAQAKGERPFISGARIIPARGMNCFQLKGLFAGKKEIDILATPSLDQSKSYSFGAAPLFPFANRIRGAQVLLDRKNFSLPLDHRGKLPRAEPHSIHGFIHDLPFKIEKILISEVVGKLKFQSSHWPSEAMVTIRYSLEESGFHFSLKAENSGQDRMPVGIGWHPYFNIPSRRRAQAILRIPADSRLAIDNYDNVFPTTEILRLAGSTYDFSGEGKTLENLHLDDCFVDLVHDSEGRTTVELIDPAANYGVRVIAHSPHINAFQIYSPVNKSFIAIEPQFNFPDPFNNSWKRDTGMVFLNPGQTVEYKISVEIFECKL